MKSMARKIRKFLLINTIKRSKNIIIEDLASNKTKKYEEISSYYDNLFDFRDCIEDIMYDK